MKTKIKSFVILMVIAVMASTVFVASGLWDEDNYSDYDIMLKWVERGVIPYVGYGNFDQNITYLGFSDVMRGLFGFSIPERYTFNSGMAHIRRHEMENFFDMTSTDSGWGNPAEFVTFRELVRFLDERVEFFEREAFVLNDIFLNGKFVVNHLHSTAEYVTESVLENVSGDGDIVIVPRTGSSVLLRNINISGRIIISAGGYGHARVTLQNSAASGVYVLGNAEIDFIGGNHIENIVINAPAVVDTTDLSRLAITPSVRAYSQDLRLYGDFENVHLEFFQLYAPSLISVNGRIEHLQSQGNVIILGDAHIREHDAPELHFINYDGLYRQARAVEIAEEGAINAILSLMDELVFNMEYAMWRQLTQHLFGQSASSSDSGTNNVPQPPEITPHAPDPTPAPER